MANEPGRVQRKRARGWKMPANTVYVGRPTRYGNPFVVGRDGKVADCMYLYTLLANGYLCLGMKATIEEQERAQRAMRDAKKYLRGKNLACWCPLIDKDGKPVPCHADILLKIANGGS